MNIDTLQKLAKLIRYFILTMTTTAGSGHTTSSLSAVELMVVLMFGGFFRADLDNPQNPTNDRLIFSKYLKRHLRGVSGRTPLVKYHFCP